MSFKQYIQKYILFALLGFYFMSLTPVHMYAHALFEVHEDSHSKNLSSEDCNFIQFANNGQGQFSSPDEFSFKAIEFIDFTFKDIIFTSQNFIENEKFYKFSLRAPPLFI